MPFTGPDDPKLPANVKRRSRRVRARWAAVWNSVFERTGDEAAAFRQANGVIKDMKTKATDFVERVLAFLGLREKAVWSTRLVNTFPDSSFLHIIPGGRKDEEGKTVPRNLRMFPVKDAQGNIDLPHLRNALARIPQSDRISQVTKNRLTARARRMLEEATKALSTGGFKLHQAPDGGWRWFAYYTNAFEDRDILPGQTQGEFFSSAALADFADFANARGAYAGGEKQMPQLWCAHAPIRWGTTTFLENVGLFNIAAGIVDDTPHAKLIADKLKDQDNLGVSHGYFGLRDGNVYTKVFTFEISPLARALVANPYTAFLEVDGMKKSTQIEMLTETLGDEDLARSLVEGAEDATKALREAGVAWKTLLEGDGPDPPEPPPDDDEDGDEETIPEEGAEEGEPTQPLAPVEEVSKALAAMLAPIAQGQKASLEAVAALVKAQGEQIQARKDAEGRFEKLEAANKALSDKLETAIESMNLPMSAFAPPAPARKTQEPPPLPPPPDGVEEVLAEWEAQQ